MATAHQFFYVPRGTLYITIFYICKNFNMFDHFTYGFGGVYSFDYLNNQPFAFHLVIVPLFTQYRYNKSQFLIFFTFF